MRNVDGLVVCSHRGPVSHALVDGRVERRPGSGGLVVALSPLLRANAGTRWIACALSNGDRTVAAGERTPDEPTRLLDLPVDLHRAFYDDACVTGLGFLFHGLVDQAYTPVFDARFRRAWTAYREVNRRFAAELRRSSAGRTVLVEDYHLMLVAAALTEPNQEPGRSATGPLAYFHHVPWCPPSYFALLPREIRVEIVSGLLAFDTLGFHARRWADQFLATCAEVLPGARCTADAVTWRDRTVPVLVAPAQLDVPQLRREAGDAATARWRDDTTGRLTGHPTGRRVVARVDRLDLWKNVVRGFRAFEHLLDRGDDDLTDGLTFVALLARSRIHLPEYRRYLAACQGEADRINRRLGRAGSGPIRLMVADDSNHHRALAVLGLADVVLANSTSDGLNLVAKEAVIAGDGGSRIVLSETTGVHEEIGRWVWTVNPFDVEETGTALAAALDAPARQPELLAAVERNSPEGWLRRRLAGLTPAAGSA